MRILLPAATALALALTAPPALAHKVIADLFPAGDRVEGEIGLSNGAFAVRQAVTVSTPDGRVLGEAVTDEEGLFFFRPTEAVTHVFRADMGMGHVALMEMQAAEIARIIAARTGAAPAPEAIAAATPGAGADAAPNESAPNPGAPVPVAAFAAAPGAPPLTDAQLAEIGRVMREEMRPLRREIAAYREKTDLTAILGGLGWIAGLCGAGFYLAARRKMEGPGA